MKKENSNIEKVIDSIIAECKWHNADFDICSGLCLPCSRVIESGKCPTLIELFGKAE